MPEAKADDRGGGRRGEAVERSDRLVGHEISGIREQLFGSRHVSNLQIVHFALFGHIALSSGLRPSASLGSDRCMVSASCESGKVAGNAPHGPGRA